MFTRITVVLLASLPITVMLGAQSVTTIKKVPLSPTSPSAEEMFHTYCAVCHGKDGKRRGRTLPLTGLARCRCGASFSSRSIRAAARWSIFGSRI
jgi:hypothetical protein